jgi:hypothetical protein
MNRAGSRSTESALVPLKPFSLSKRDTPALGRWKAYFYRRPKDNEVKRLRSRRTMSMDIFSDSIQSMEELLRKSKKVKRGATLKEAEIDGAWLIAYERISRRFRDDKNLGVSRYPYELAPSVSPFSGGNFEHREWAIRRSMEWHRSLRPLLEYEAHYAKSAGYWMIFSSSAMARQGETLKLEDTTEVEEVEMFDVWAMMAVRYGLRVVGLRVEFYKRSAKDPMHARLVMPVLLGQNNKPATDDLDDVMKKLDMHMAT